MLSYRFIVTVYRVWQPPQATDTVQVMSGPPVVLPPDFQGIATKWSQISDTMLMASSRGSRKNSRSWLNLQPARRAWTRASAVSQSDVLQSPATTYGAGIPVEEDNSAARSAAERVVLPIFSRPGIDGFVRM
jgi:hypothetical protein